MQPLTLVAADSAPGRPIEDCVLASPTTIVVVDGAGSPSADDCVHGVAWYAHQLAAQTTAALLLDERTPPAHALAQALTRVAGLHSITCDLRSPGAPSAAVGILRIGPDTVETLALGDVSIVVDTGGDPQVTRDLRVEALSGTEQDVLAGLKIGTPEHAAALALLAQRRDAIRNRPHGWWAAASDPQAAQHAVTDSYRCADVRLAAAFTAGAARPVDRMRLSTWREHLDLAVRLGPAGLIARVRAIEAADPDGVTHPRATRHDDATVAFTTLR